MQTITVMTANLMRVSLEQYGDATNYVGILDHNNLDDYLYNKAIIAFTSTAHRSGDNILVIKPTLDIRIGDLVYCDGFPDTFGIVLAVMNTYSVPKGLPFASCPSMPPSPQRILPAAGNWLSTNVTIAPALLADLPLGSQITFAIGGPTQLEIPTNPNSRGVPV